MYDIEICPECVSIPQNSGGGRACVLIHCNDTNWAWCSMDTNMGQAAWVNVDT